MSRKKFLMLATVVGVLALDRWLKYMAGEGAQATGPVGQFVLFKNYGLVFSWPLSGTAAIGLMIIALTIVIAVWLRTWRFHEHRKLVAMTLVLAGAVSNIFDRIVYGFIIDWAYLGRWWPVFNLADVLITVGLAIYLITPRPPRPGHDQPRIRPGE